MSTDKLWRPGTEVPEQYGTRALITHIELSSDGARRPALFGSTAVWTRIAGGGFADCWCPIYKQYGYGFEPSANFLWLPVDALADILIAEHDIEDL